MTDLSLDNQILMGGLWYCAKHGLPPEPEALKRIEAQLAIADRNGNRRDRATGLGPQDESGGAQSAIAQKGLP